jgi:hypothetical protein
MKPILVIIFLLAFSLSYAKVFLPKNLSKDLWDSFLIIELTNSAQLVKKEGDKDIISIESVSCVFENYYACAFFSGRESERKLFVAAEGTENFLNTLAKGGAILDSEYPRLDLLFVNCSKSDKEIECSFVQ